jgi:hypothetical protein
LALGYPQKMMIDHHAHVQTAIWINLMNIIKNNISQTPMLCCCFNIHHNGLFKSPFEYTVFMKNSSAVKGMGQVIGNPNNFSSSEKTKSHLRPLVEVIHFEP